MTLTASRTRDQKKTADQEIHEVALSKDWPGHFAQIPHWITLHPGLKAQAVRAFNFYAAHINANHERRVVFPGLESVAYVLGLSRGDKVTPYNRALVEAGAITVEKINTPTGSRNRYVLHFNPPPGYTGPTGLKELYTNIPRKKDKWNGWSAATAPAERVIEREQGEKTRGDARRAKCGWFRAYAREGERNSERGSQRGSERDNAGRAAGDPDDRAADAARIRGG
jgi:hypothetical protein